MSQFSLIPMDPLTRDLLAQILAKMFKHDIFTRNIDRKHTGDEHKDNVEKEFKEKHNNGNTKV